MKTDALFSDVVLLSGGVDSSFLCFSQPFADTPALALFVDYGQPAARQEEKSARLVAQAAELDFEFVKVVGLPLGDMRDWRRGSSVVPARNLWLIALAAAFGRTVWLGAVPEDWSDYRDCRPLFLSELDEAMRTAYDAEVRWAYDDRAARVAYLEEHGHSRLVWSCYGPGPEPCGACASCTQ